MDNVEGLVLHRINRSLVLQCALCETGWLLESWDLGRGVDVPMPGVISAVEAHSQSSEHRKALLVLDPHRGLAYRGDPRGGHLWVCSCGDWEFRLPFGALIGREPEEAWAVHREGSRTSDSSPLGSGGMNPDFVNITDPIESSPKNESPVYLLVRLDNLEDLYQVRRRLHTLYDENLLVGNLADVPVRPDRAHYASGEKVPYEEVHQIMQRFVVQRPSS